MTDENMAPNYRLDFAEKLAEFLMRPVENHSNQTIESLSLAIGTEIGLRKDNEDRAVFARVRDQDGRVVTLAVVADGMGGLLEGAKCAALSVAYFLEEFSKCFSKAASIQDALIAGVEKASNVVHALYKGEGGSTLVAVAIADSEILHWINVGDSRLYLIKKNSLLQVTVDDTIAGATDVPVLRNTWLSGALTQYLGSADLDPSFGSIDICSKTKILLCSDGVHYVANEALAKILAHAPDALRCTERILSLALWCGGHDNATCVVIFPNDRKGEMHPNLSFEIWDPFEKFEC